MEPQAQYYPELPPGAGGSLILQALRSKPPRKLLAQVPVVKFPYDLILIVLGYLEDDRNTLCSIASADKSWCSAVQRILFRSPYISSQDTMRSLHELLSTTTRLATLVIELRIAPPPRRIGGRRNPSPDDVPRWVHHAIPALAPHLPHLRALHFENIEFMKLDDATLTCLRGLEDVQELRFVSCRFPRERPIKPAAPGGPPCEGPSALDNFEEIVCALPTLTRLTLDRTKWQDSQAGDLCRGRARRKLQLRSLRVHSHNEWSLLFRWLCYNHCNTVSRLELMRLPDADFERATAYFRQLGASLKTLVLGAQVRTMTEYELLDSFQKLDVSANRCLRSLDLVVLDLLQETVRWLPQVLRQTSEMPLRHISFEIPIVGREHPDPRQQFRQLNWPVWTEIGQLLETCWRDTLQEVVFVHWRASDWSIRDARPALLARYPALERQKLLLIETAQSGLVLAYSTFQ